MRVANSFLKPLLAATVMSLAVVGQAHALVAFSVGAVGGVDYGYAPSEVSVANFDGANASGVIETDAGPAGSVGLFTLTDINVAAAPVGDTTQFEAIQPGGSAKFDFTNYVPGVSSFSVYVGSIDSYNSFDVTTSVADYHYTGSDFLNHNGDQFSHLTNRRIYFQFAPTETFKSIIFSSGGIAFEYDDIAAARYTGFQPTWRPEGTDLEVLTPDLVTPAPEPAAWALMLVGFGLVGGAARRRNAVAA